MVPDCVWIVYVIHNPTLGRTAIQAFADQEEAREWIESRAEAARNLDSNLILEPLAVK